MPSLLLILAMSGFVRLLCVFVIGLVNLSDAARILAYYPTPSISHQLPFRPLTLELVKRGHEVVVITPNPIFPKGKAPANLTELDMHDLSYNLWMETVKNLGVKLSDPSNMPLFVNLMATVMEKQLNTKEVQAIIKDRTKSFDLLIIEAFADAALGLTHVIKAPVIEFSSLGGNFNTLKLFGAMSQPFLFPFGFRNRIYNLTKIEKISEIYKEQQMESLFYGGDEIFEKTLRRLFGQDLPSLEELRKRVDMIFVNVHPIWDANRPVPPNFIYLGGIHQSPTNDLPKDLETYLSSSKNGVIYVSFGSNVDPSKFPDKIINTLVNVFSKLPYDILWKWNKDELPGRTQNIRISKWLPQPDLLKHPNVKLFITQGGLQSTDEAINAGVPLLGMPIFGDQFLNVEQYEYHGIGVQVNIDAVTEEKLSNGINKILNDESYRRNIVKLRELMHDQPQSPLERAVWWTEYVIRHQGAGHLRAASANLSLAQYYELELVLYVLLAVLSGIFLVSYFIYYMCKSGVSGKVKKN